MFLAYIYPLFQNIWISAHFLKCIWTCAEILIYIEMDMEQCIRASPRNSQKSILKLLFSTILNLWRENIYLCNRLIAYKTDKWALLNYQKPALNMTTRSYTLHPRIHGSGARRTLELWRAGYTIEMRFSSFGYIYSSTVGATFFRGNLNFQDQECSIGQLPGFALTSPQCYYRMPSAVGQL